MQFPCTKVEIEIEDIVTHYYHGSWKMNGKLRRASNIIFGLIKFISLETDKTQNAKIKWKNFPNEHFVVSIY